MKNSAHINLQNQSDHLGQESPFYLQPLQQCNVMQVSSLAMTSSDVSERVAYCQYLEKCKKKKCLQINVQIYLPVPSVDETVERWELSYTVGDSTNWDSGSRKLFGTIHYILTYTCAMIQLLHSWAYTQQKHSYAHQKSCRRMFISLFFIKVRTWKQRKCLSIIEWIDCGIFHTKLQKYYATTERTKCRAPG